MSGSFDTDVRRAAAAAPTQMRTPTAAPAETTPSSPSSSSRSFSKSNASSDQQSQLFVCVNGLSGTICKVPACRDSTIAQVKRSIQEQLAIPESHQRLVLGCKVLDDFAFLSPSLLQNSSDANLPSLALTLVRRSDELVRLLQSIRQASGYQVRVLLWNAPPDFRADREVVLAALQQGGDVLQFAALPLQMDREVALAAVQQNGMALKYTGLALKADSSVVLAAVRRSGSALEFASETLRGERQ
ncbi:unnamed protein product, partial [Polarella glacialis]